MEEGVKDVALNLKKFIVEEAEIVNEVEKAISSIPFGEIMDDFSNFTNIIENTHRKISEKNKKIIESLENIGLINNIGDLLISEQEYNEFMSEYLPNLEEVGKILKKYDPKLTISQRKYFSLYKNFIGITDFEKSLGKGQNSILRYQYDNLKLLSNPFTFAQLYVLHVYMKNKLNGQELLGYLKDPKKRLQFNCAPSTTCSVKEIEGKFDHNRLEKLKDLSSEAFYSSLKNDAKLYLSKGGIRKSIPIIVNFNKDENKFSLKIIRIGDAISFSYSPTYLTLSHEYTHVLRAVAGEFSKNLKPFPSWLGVIYQNMEEYLTIEIDFFNENDVRKSFGYNNRRFGHSGVEWEIGKIDDNKKSLLILKFYIIANVASRLHSSPSIKDLVYCKLIVEKKTLNDLYIYGVNHDFDDIKKLKELYSEVEKNLIKSEAKEEVSSEEEKDSTSEESEASKLTRKVRRVKGKEKIEDEKSSETAYETPSARKNDNEENSLDKEILKKLEPLIDSGVITLAIAKKLAKDSNLQITKYLINVKIQNLLAEQELTIDTVEKMTEEEIKKISGDKNFFTDQELKKIRNRSMPESKDQTGYKTEKNEPFIEKNNSEESKEEKSKDDDTKNSKGGCWPGKCTLY